ncbi:MAG: EFR1 family ferrodoxin [Clostridiales bacterium]|nr:EFR1 family ferrodoxin [Clostridiales bacterium]
MILYFSATGNCEYVAKRIAEKSGDETVSVAERYKKRSFDFPGKIETLGIVSPTYAWGLPIIVREFLQQMSFENKPDYIYFIATYGTTPGQTGKFAEDILKPKGLSLSARFSVKMPDTWTPTFDLSNKEKVRRINERAEAEIVSIIGQVSARETGDHMKNKMPLLFARALYCAEYDSMRKTQHFVVKDSCIGCGLCARNCQVSALEIKDGRPVWVKSQCVMCLGCLHHCPKFAIQYGERTKNHGQYTHPRFSRHQ